MSDDVRTLGTGEHLRLVSRGGWEYITRPGISGIVAIIAITDDDELILVEQHRPPVGAAVLELPAGLAGDQPDLAAEAIVDAARRELEEETGYRAETMELITRGATSPGLSDEIVSVMRAGGLRRVGSGGGDASESITVHRVPAADLRGYLEAWMASGGLVDLKVWAAFELGGRSG